MRAAKLKVFRALTLAIFILRWTPASPQKGVLEAAEVCADFEVEGQVGSAWTFADCAQVWTHFVSTLPPYVMTRAPHRDIWKDTAIELRRKGVPCVVSSLPTHDGAGSSTIRHLAAWVFAVEMGCDWATPSWGGTVPRSGEAGAMMYCHRTATTAEMDFSKPPQELWAMRRCSIINWLAYFQFDVPSVDVPVNGTSEIQLEVRGKSVVRESWGATVCAGRRLLSRRDLQCSSQVRSCFTLGWHSALCSVHLRSCL